MIFVVAGSASHWVMGMRDNTGSKSSGISELIEENIQVLSQLTQLVSRLPPNQYQQSFGLQGQHTMGKHVRHIIDHYEAFLLGLQEKPPVKVNYEHRQREESLEREPHRVCYRLLTVCRSLEQLRDDHHQSPVRLDYPTGAITIEMNSSVGRELVFLSSHTIHHMAIIGLLAEQLGIQPARDFGVHPSTLRHWQREEARLTETA
jgi:uncharacterized damage-inducible protein DinB